MKFVQLKTVASGSLQLVGHFLSMNSNEVQAITVLCMRQQ